MKIRIKYNAPVVLTFALISGLVLGLNYLTGGKSNQLLFITYRGSWTDPLNYVRLFTHVLGHANLEHYMSNMMLFLVLGPMLEEKYGSKDLLIVIVVTSLVTGIVNMIIGKNGLLGASGVVFAFIIMASMTSFQSGQIPLTLILVFCLYVGQEIASGLFSQDNISQMAHIAGGITGAVCGYVAQSRRR